jgi:hypothetical protein
MSEPSPIERLALRIGMAPDDENGDQVIGWRTPITEIGVCLCVTALIAAVLAVIGLGFANPWAMVPAYAGGAAIMTMSRPTGNRIRRRRTAVAVGYVVLLAPPFAIRPWLPAAPHHHRPAMFAVCLVAAISAGYVCAAITRLPRRPRHGTASADAAAGASRG